jgi:undecaprenyl diphosphate synthase
MGEPLPIPCHVAIIMDGNGRWAEQRGLPRAGGHRQGVETVRRVVRSARESGVEYLTLFSFSTENWTRPKSEIGELFLLLKTYIRRDLAELHQSNVRLRLIGDRPGIPGDLLALLVDAERLTKDNTGQKLVIAFNYGARAEIAAAARQLARLAARGELDPESIDADMLERHLDTVGIPDPDLIIRTSGEQRISNFLLWQAAYAEFLFVDKLWPDFTPEDFRAAIAAFGQRKRRFGGLVSRQPARSAGS